MLAIPATLTATDLVATMACRVAREFAARHPLQVLAHPLPLPDFPVSQL
ncbi:transcriptional regulator [Bordetella pertussis]|nr:transcriptional regulator [Bordetella pertussis]